MQFFLNIVLVSTIHKRSPQALSKKPRRESSPQVSNKFTNGGGSLYIGREPNKLLNRKIINPPHDMVKIPKP